MKLLPGPYGWDSPDGAVISLRSTAPVDDAKLEATLLAYSCYPPAIPKIQSCLRYSGRYDCILQAGWYREQRANVTRELAEIGVQLQHVGYLKDRILQAC